MPLLLTGKGCLCTPAAGQHWISEKVLIVSLQMELEGQNITLQVVIINNKGLMCSNREDNELTVVRKSYKDCLFGDMNSLNRERKLSPH